MIASKIQAEDPTPPQSFGQLQLSSLAGMLKVSIQRELMELTSTVLLVQAMVNSLLAVMTTVLCNYSEIQLAWVQNHALIVATLSTSSALSSVLMTLIFGPSVVMIRPSCSGRNAEELAQKLQADSYWLARVLIRIQNFQLKNLKVEAFYLSKFIHLFISSDLVSFLFCYILSHGVLT